MSEPHYKAGRKHLVKQEPLFKPLFTRIGPCTLQPNPDGFGILARSIISQQISGKAAESIAGRLIKACGRSGLRPEKVAKLTDEEIRSCGLSANKLLSLRSLTEHFLDDPALKGKLDPLSDQEIHDHLIPIRGIGPWTVQMFLIFSLGRMDVLPVLDLGLRAGVQLLYGMEEPPAPNAVMELAEPWKPYRTIATWYLWRNKDSTKNSRTAQKK
jgi:DNA-3-methyladenine glycosylase II